MFEKKINQIASPAAGQMALQFQGTELGSPVLGLEKRPNVNIQSSRVPSKAVGEMFRNRPIAKDKHVHGVRQSSQCWLFESESGKPLVLLDLA